MGPAEMEADAETHSQVSGRAQGSFMEEWGIEVSNSGGGGEGSRTSQDLQSQLTWANGCA
jgi:hypothetical protein